MKPLEISKYIKENPEEDIRSILSDHNLDVIFSPVFKTSFSFRDMNLIVAYIIYAYTNESKWLNVRQDRKDNKIKIFTGLGVKITNEITDIIECENIKINEAISNYVSDQASWEFQQISTFLDYHQRMIKFINQRTESGLTEEFLDKDGQKQVLFKEYPAEDIAKVNRQKGDLLEKAYEARTKADELIQKVKKDFVQMEHAIQSDFNFSITDEKKIDPMSWRDFIVNKSNVEKNNFTL